jgi:hypothetical protein
MRESTLTTAPVAPPRTASIAGVSSVPVLAATIAVVIAASTRNVSMPSRYSSWACRWADWR